MHVIQAPIRKKFSCTLLAFLLCVLCLTMLGAASADAGEAFSSLYTLEGREAVFPAGKQYAVYSGPGEDYLRGANGKAVVSTNAPIQVFCRESGWLMIQYAIDHDHSRIGWIHAASGVSVSDMPAPSCSATLPKDSLITDDPFGSEASLLAFSMDIEVDVLAQAGDWCYVEGHSGDWFRGFVRKDQLTPGTSFDLAAWAYTDQIGTLLADTSAYDQPMTADNSASGDDLITTVLDAGLKVHVLAAEGDWVKIIFANGNQFFDPCYVARKDILITSYDTVVTGHASLLGNQLSVTMDPTIFRNGVPVSVSSVNVYDSITQEFLGSITDLNDRHQLEGSVSVPEDTSSLRFTAIPAEAGDTASAIIAVIEW